jgi:hypothetical protein
MGTRAVNDMITRIVKTTRWISLPDFFIKGLVIGLKVKKIATFIDIHELISLNFKCAGNRPHHLINFKSRV